MLLCGIATQAPRMARLGLYKGWISAPHTEANSNLQHVLWNVCFFTFASFSLKRDKVLKNDWICIRWREVLPHHHENAERVNSSTVFFFFWSLFPTSLRYQGGCELEQREVREDLLNADFRWLLRSILLWMQHKSQGPGGAEEVQRQKAPGGGQIAAESCRFTLLLCQQHSWFDWKSGLNSFPSSQTLNSKSSGSGTYGPESAGSSHLATELHAAKVYTHTYANCSQLTNFSLLLTY